MRFGIGGGDGTEGEGTFRALGEERWFIVVVVSFGGGGVDGIVIVVGNGIGIGIRIGIGVGDGWSIRIRIRIRGRSLGRWCWCGRLAGCRCRRHRSSRRRRRRLNHPRLSLQILVFVKSRKFNDRLLQLPLAFLNRCFSSRKRAERLGSGGGGYIECAESDALVAVDHRLLTSSELSLSCCHDCVRVRVCGSGHIPPLRRRGPIPTRRAPRTFERPARTRTRTRA